MYRISKKFTFEAAHFLPRHDGKCRRMHGHSFVGYAILQGDALHPAGPKSGMLMDYGDISAILKPFVDERLDHFLLNDSTGLEDPTSEMLAKWIYEQLLPSLPNLVAVRIEETCTSAAEYWADSSRRH